MNRIASQKHFFVPETLLKVFWVVTVFALLKSPLPGQEKSDYRGVWQTETPDSGRLVLIIKRNYLASYFWADNADRTVYQGSWSNHADGVTLKWEDGSSHLIEQDLFSYKITHIDALGNTLYNASTERVTEEILGQWAKAPSSPDDQMSVRDRAKGFFGVWKIGAETMPYYLVIEPDRSAATNWTYGDLNSSGLRGLWAKQGSELHIAWDTGHYGILKQNERNVTFKLIAPGSVIEKDTSEELIVTRTGKESLPVEWQNLYADETANQAQSAAFANRTDAIAFYRGSWIVQRSENAFERIEIGRFGGLETSADETLHGSWRISGQDIFMNWDDGMRKILKPAGKGFLIYEYKPGRPIDGVPTRIFSAAPENTRKLARYAEGQKEVALNLLHLATAAGVTAGPGDGGWGHALMSWVWPFEDNVKGARSSGALLQPDDEAPRNMDPWWWPFWSETPLIESTTEPGSAHEAVEVASDLEAMPKTKARTRPQRPDLDWPF